MFDSAKKIGVRPRITTKLKWLKDILEKLIDMDKHYSTPTGTTIYGNLGAVEEMLHNVEFGKLPKKRHLIQCNEMLKYLKGLYTFDIDWRGDIINCDRYTEYALNKESKINLIYSWTKW
jgi:hypothetical protein